MVLTGKTGWMLPPGRRRFSQFDAQRWHDEGRGVIYILTTGQKAAVTCKSRRRVMTWMGGGRYLVESHTQSADEAAIFVHQSDGGGQPEGKEAALSHLRG